MTVTTDAVDETMRQLEGVRQLFEQQCTVRDLGIQRYPSGIFRGQYMDERSQTAWATLTGCLVDLELRARLGDG